MAWEELLFVFAVVAFAFFFFFFFIYCTSSCVLVQFRNDFLVFTLRCKWCAQVPRWCGRCQLPTAVYRNVICNQHFIFRVKQFICGSGCVRVSAMPCSPTCVCECVAAAYTDTISNELGDGIQIYWAANSSSYLYVWTWTYSARAERRSRY